MTAAQQNLQTQHANATATIANMSSQQQSLQNQLSQVQAASAAAVQQHNQHVAGVTAGYEQTLAALRQQADQARAYQANLEAQLQAALNRPPEVVHVHHRRRRLF
jgi:chromosome segregation ATPase